MKPPPYKASVISAGRARTEAAFNAPPYTHNASHFFKVTFDRTHEDAQGEAWDYFRVMRADAEAPAWRNTRKRTEGCTEGVSFYALVPHTAYLASHRLPMSSDVACVFESVTLAALGAALAAWGVWNVM